MRFFEDPSCAKGNRQPDATFCKRISPYLSYEIVFVATLCFFGTPKLKPSRVIRKFEIWNLEIWKFECMLPERTSGLLLGFLHKCTLTNAHPHLKCIFASAPHNKIWDPRHDGLLQGMQYSSIYERSLFRLIHVYNALPQHVRAFNNIKEFQCCLTQIARIKCELEHDNWYTFLSPRNFTGNLHL